MSEKAVDFAMAIMPFGLCAIPSIGPATIKAQLAKAGLRSRLFDFNLEYLATIDTDLTEGWRLHDEIAYLWDFLPGEWLFSPRQDPERDIAYLKALLEERVVPGPLVEKLARLRPQADAFAEYCARRLAASGAPVVGFTTSFMQTQPSLAAAAHLRRLRPETKILFGGANCFGEMGPALLEAFEQIDVVATGEVDLTISDMVRALSEDDTDRIAALPGYATRGPKGVKVTKDLKLPIKMNDVPDPDFSDYFDTKAQLEALRGPVEGLPMFLPIETSRGCWWGAKSHCTFCGLNADRMDFRSKSPERAFAEFERQSERYGKSHFFAVDNIVDQSYFSTVMKDLAASPKDYFVHYEIKANLRRTHVDAMHDAGVMKVQPGIEALNSGILKLMKKGISALQNVQTLKWLTEGGFDVSWFILTGFPGETLEQYEETMELLRHVTHLTPPGNVAPVYIERFSPYQSRPEEFGIQLTGHTHWYDFAFPGLSPEMLGRIAYRFDYSDPQRDKRIDRLIEERLSPLVQQWKAAFAAHGPTLHLMNCATGSALVTGPLDGPERIMLLPDNAAEMLRGCDAVRARDALLKADKPTDWDDMGQRALPPEELMAYLQRFASRVQDMRHEELNGEDLLDRMIQTGLILVEGNRLLAMPLHVNRARLAPLIDTPPLTEGAQAPWTAPVSTSL